MGKQYTRRVTRRTIVPPIEKRNHQRTQSSLDGRPVARDSGL